MIYWVLLSFTKFDKVSLDFTGFYRVLYWVFVAFFLVASGEFGREKREIENRKTRPTVKKKRKEIMTNHRSYRPQSVFCPSQPSRLVFPRCFTEFHTIRLGFTRFSGLHSNLLSFTRFDWVWLGLTGLDWVLLNSTGFYWVSMGFTGFYWVWLGFTGFS